MKSMSARDAKNEFGRLIDTARAEPVTIEKHGREGFQLGFDICSHVLESKLTDATKTGGLFGVRFS
jgi:hypothetical protein